MLQHFRPFQPNNPVQPKYLCQKNPLNFHCSISFFQVENLLIVNDLYRQVLKPSKVWHLDRTTRQMIASHSSILDWSPIDLDLFG